MARRNMENLEVRSVKNTIRRASKMSNSIRFKKLILAVAAVLCCGICIFSISGNASAATYTDKSGKWTCTIVDETAKTVSIKPAKQE